jgi:shikimate kinase
MNRVGNFFFIGLMGSGKTTVGRMLARRRRLPFYDSDHEIESRTGVKIPTIFEIEGEEGFRERETETIIELCQKRGIVLATGGGAILRAENRVALTQNGTVIYLRASVEDLYQRTRRDPNRPLLQVADPLAKLAELYAVRDPLYRSIASITIETSWQSLACLLERLDAQLPPYVAA